MKTLKSWLLGALDPRSGHRAAYDKIPGAPLDVNTNVDFIEVVEKSTLEVAIRELEDSRADMKAMGQINYVKLTSERSRSEKLRQALVLIRQRFIWIGEDSSHRKTSAGEVARGSIIHINKAINEYSAEATPNRAENDRDAAISRAEKLIIALQNIKTAATKGDETTHELECHHLADDAINKYNEDLKKVTK